MSRRTTALVAVAIICCFTWFASLMSNTLTEIRSLVDRAETAAVAAEKAVTQAKAPLGIALAAPVKDTASLNSLPPTKPTREPASNELMTPTKIIPSPNSSSPAQGGGDNTLCSMIDASKYAAMKDSYKDAHQRDTGRAECCVMGTVKLPKPFEIALHCNPSEITRAVLKEGMWEDGITRRMSAVLTALKDGQHENIFMDVGGNVGYFSLLAASLGYSTVTVEAMTYNSQLLKRSASQNGFDINIVRQALVAPGMLASMPTVCLDMPVGNGDNGIVSMETKSSSSCANLAKTNTMDGAFEAAGKTMAPRAIKMDIEGFESHALAGATKLLVRADAPCYIWFEYVRHAVERSGAKTWDILDILANANYEIKDVDPKITTLFSRTAPGQWTGVPDAFFGEARNKKCPEVK
jgi:FkbM family methyltransferase